MLGDEDLYAKSPKVDFDFRGFISWWGNFQVFACYLPMLAKLGVNASQPSPDTVASKATLAAPSAVAAVGVTLIFQLSADPQSFNFVLFFAFHAPSVASVVEIAVSVYVKFVVEPFSPGALYPIKVQLPATFRSAKNASCSFT